MAENANGAEKTEQPTPRRIEEARKEGQVAFSHDLMVGIGLVVGFCLLIALGPWFVGATAETMRWCLTDALHAELSDRDAWRALLAHLVPLGLWTGAIITALFALDIAAGVFQVGFQPQLKPLIPKGERLDPIAGFKRIFSLRGAMRALFALLKLVLVGALAWHMIASHLQVESLIDADLGRRVAAEASSLGWLGLKLALVIFALGFCDWMYQRMQHTRDLMMTKQEVKEEFKQSEGDPMVRGRIRQIQRKLAMSRMMQEVPKADVVITNPTHVAVALRYDQQTMAAPVVVAKGYDDQAQRIKAIAAEHGIPMVENVALARALAREVEVGKPIATAWYQAVAEVLALVYKLRARAT